MLKAETAIIKAEVASKKGTEYFVLVSLVPSDEAIGNTKTEMIVKTGTKLEIKDKITHTPDIMPKNAIFWDGVSLSLSFFTSLFYLIARHKTQKTIYH